MKTTKLFLIVNLFLFQNVFSQEHKLQQPNLTRGEIKEDCIAFFDSSLHVVSKDGSYDVLAQMRYLKDDMTKFTLLHFNTRERAENVLSFRVSTPQKKRSLDSEITEA